MTKKKILNLKKNNSQIYVWDNRIGKLTVQ